MLNEGLFYGFKKVLIAVSGGSDSMALFHLMKESNIKFDVATVDHGLRAESADEAQQVAAWCGATVLHWDEEKPTAGIQAAARMARYNLLVAHAKSIGAEAIVTAHTLDDQAETVMMRLCRGSSPVGLAGMAAIADFKDFPLIRPLLWVSKADLVESMADRPFINDPSNQNEAFTRVRMRQLMPSLAVEGLTADRLGRFAARQHMINEALDYYSLNLLKEMGKAPRFNAIPLESAPFVTVMRVLSRLFDEAGDEAIPERLEKLEELTVGLLTALSQGDPFHATLKGAKLTLTANKLLLMTKELPRSS